MSGGYLDYAPGRIGEELFPGLEVDYGDYGFKQARKARNINPFENREVSELAWDCICLMHSLEWYKSGDTSEDTYYADLNRFKIKWFGRTDDDRKNALRKDLEEYYKTLKKELE